MTDLKNINEATLLAKLAEAEAWAVERVRDAAAEARRQVGQAVRALSDAKGLAFRSTLDVINAAAWCGVAEVQVFYPVKRVNGVVRGNYDNGMSFGHVPAGHYRALLVLMPIAALKASK